MPGLHREALRSTPITLPDQAMTITPIAQIVHFAWPGGRFSWHRPAVVEVARGDRTERIPIHNATRSLVMGLVLAELALGTLAWWGQQRILSRRRTG